MHQQDTRTYENGAITLYRRSDHKSPRWHCRIKLPNERRYLRKSTGEDDLDKAKTATITEYYVLLSKQQNNLPIFSKNFDDAAKAFIDEQIFRHSIDGISDGRLAYQKNVVGRWFTMYFGKRAIDRISTDDINEFWKWRINYWKSDEGTAELKITGRSVAMNPKSTTLNEEKISLKQVFNFAAEKGWISRNTLPIIKLPIKVKPESREHFTIEEWRSISLYMQNRWTPLQNITDPEEAALLAEYCVPHPLATMTQKLNCSGNHLKVANKAYVLATEFQPSPFTGFAEEARRLGWKVEELATHHFTMISMPRETANVFMRHAA